MICLVDKSIIKSLFTKFTQIYGNLWSSRCKSPTEWEDCCDVWLNELRRFTTAVLRSAVIESMHAYKDFPPTLMQLIDLCLKHSGVPTVSKVVEALSRREMNHPLILDIYHKIGDWRLKNIKEVDLVKCVNEHYASCRGEFLASEPSKWAALENYNNQKALPIVPKMPSPEQRLGFKENLAKWMKRAEEEKIKIQNGTIVHPTWPKEKYTMLHGEFDEKIFNERKRYFLSLTDTEALSLPSEDRFDRIRYDSERRSSLGKN